MGFRARRTAPGEQAVHKLLRPIVRCALRKSLYFQDFIDILKGVFVEVAEEELLLRGEKASASRLSTATGLTRRDVSGFVKDGYNIPEQQHSLLTRVVGLWEQDRRFQTKNGRPRILAYGSDDSDFSTLVRSVSAHVGPAAVLNELVCNGAVEIGESGAKLVRSTIDFTVDKVKAYGIIGKDIADLIATLEHNLSSTIPDQNLHLRTEFDNIYVSAIPKIRAWMMKEGRALHTRARDFLSQYDMDVSPSSHKDSTAGVRVVLNAFGNIDTSHSEGNLQISPNKVSQKT